jgi:hypothetical protein
MAEHWNKAYNNKKQHFPDIAVKELALGTLLIAILATTSFPNFILPVQRAYAIDFTLDQASCENTMGGTWLDAFDTCEISESATIVSGDRVIISPGTTLHILFGGSLTIGEDGAIANSGIIENDGEIHILTFSSFRNNAGGIINNGSTGLINNGDEGFGITNDGTINNDGTIRSADSGVRNNVGAVINNNEGGLIIFSSDSQFLNDGTINNNGGSITLAEAHIINNEGAIINNSGRIILSLDSFSSISNKGTINNSGTMDVGDLFINEVTGIINNDGTINNMNIGNNAEGIINHGTISNDAGGVISNDGIITNSLEGTINNNEGATINNEGIVNNLGTINDYCGTFTGNWEGVSIVDLCTLDPVLVTKELISDITNSGLQTNVKNSLLGPLKQIESILTDENSNNDVAVCDKLTDFISNVNSKESSGKLMHQQAAEFRDAANAIGQLLECT